MLRIFQIIFITLYITFTPILLETIYAGYQLLDEGTSQGYPYKLDCTGAGVSCSRTGTTGTINVSAGGSGSMTTVEEGDVQVGGSDIVTLDFDSTDFDVAETPDTEINVTIPDDGHNHTTTSISGIVTGDITDDTLLEADLDATDTPSDEECLTYESGAGGDFEWQACGAGGGDVADLTVQVFSPAAIVGTGDGKVYIPIQSKYNGNDIDGVHAQLVTAGTGGTVDIQIAKCSAVATGNVCSGTVVDVLSTKLTVDTNEDDSSTAATAAVINTSNDNIVTGDVLRIDIDDARDTTDAKGLIVTIETN